MTAESLERSAAARYAANVSWARTPNRSERTAPARANSPVSYGYWVRKLTSDGKIRSQDISAAAENAHRAYMAGLSRKATAARKKRTLRREW
jgi:hypothetical protein